MIAQVRRGGARAAGLRDGFGAGTTPYALGLMALRSLTIAAKFGLTLFIARYLGLAELGVYGLIASAAALAPVLFGFGVSNNLGREAARKGPASIATPMLQYLLALLPLYAATTLIGAAVFPARAAAILGLTALLFLEHVQTDMFALMTITGRPYAANVVNFIRAAGWILIYAPLALRDNAFRTVEAIGVAWLAGCAVATVLTAAFTSEWRWLTALRGLPRTHFRFPHRHGSTALYLNDVANTGFQYVDRYVVGVFLSPTALGVYVLFWSITNALSNLITTALIQTRKGELVQIAHAATTPFNGRLRSVAWLTGRMAAGMGVFAIAVMYLAVPYLGRPEVDPYLPLMFILCAALVARTLYEVVGIAFYAYGRDDIMLWSGMLILGVALGLNLALDPVFGIWGAGAALLASYVIGVLARRLIIHRGFAARHREAISTDGRR